MLKQELVFLGARLHQSHFIGKSGLMHTTLNSVFLNRQDLKAIGGSIVVLANADSYGVWLAELSGLC